MVSFIVVVLMRIGFTMSAGHFRNHVIMSTIQTNTFTLSHQTLERVHDQKTIETQRLVQSPRVVGPSREKILISSPAIMKPLVSDLRSKTQPKPTLFGIPLLLLSP